MKGITRVEAWAEAVQLTPGPGYPDDVASAIYFVASDEGRYLNGQMLNVDGGIAGKV